VAFAQDRHGDALPAVCARLEGFADNRAAGTRCCSRKARSTSIRSICSAVPTNCSPSAARSIVADEFALRRTGAGRESLHLIEHFLALAGRFGFAVVERIDLSREAAPTLDYLLRVISRHARRCSATWA